MSTQDKSQKKVKAKGPFRTGVLIPFILVIGAIILGSILFLDVSIRKSLEFIGTKVNGAEVNIASVTTNFKDLSIVVNKIELTNPESPDFNRIEIGVFRYKLLWDALLRAKFVIEESIIGDILINTKRHSTGYVAPPEPPSSEENKLVQQALDKTKEEFKGNVIGDIASVLSGDNGGKVELGELKSRAHLKNLEKLIQETEANLIKTSASLPKEEEFNLLQKRSKAIDWNGLKNIQKAPKILKEADAVKKDAEKALKAYEKAAANINRNLKQVKTETGRIDDLVAEDLNDISKRLKLPTLNPEAIAQSLFGDQLTGYMEKFNRYKSMLEKYLPPKKSEGEKSKPIKISRGEGRNYRFGTPNSYPMFWLKLMRINSQNDQGSVEGSLTDVSSNLALINKISRFNLKADFPAEEVRRIEVLATYDYKNNGIIKSQIEVGSFPIREKQISKSDKAKFSIAKAQGNLKMNLKYENEKMNFTTKTIMNKIDYQIDTEDKVMADILGQVTSGTQLLTLDARATGPMSSLRWQIKSNLADSIKKSADRYVQKQIDAKKAEIKSQVEGQIAAQRKEIKGKVAAMENQYKAELEKNKKKLKELTAQIDKEKKKMTSGLPKGLR